MDFVKSFCFCINLLVFGIFEDIEEFEIFLWFVLECLEYIVSEYRNDYILILGFFFKLDILVIGGFFFFCNYYDLLKVNLFKWYFGYFRYCVIFYFGCFVRFFLEVFKYNIIFNLLFLSNVNYKMGFLGIEVFFDVLKVNKSLINLDLRFN